MKRISPVSLYQTARGLLLNGSPSSISAWRSASSAVEKRWSLSRGSINVPVLYVGVIVGHDLSLPHVAQYSTMRSESYAHRWPCFSQTLPASSRQCRYLQAG